MQGFWKAFEKSSEIAFKKAMKTVKKIHWRKSLNQTAERSIKNFVWNEKNLNSKPADVIDDFLDYYIIASWHQPRSTQNEILLWVTGGDIKHIFLLQFYAIESRNVPIFRYHSHKKTKAQRKQEENLRKRARLKRIMNERGIES